jgi:two-component system response regulator
MNQPTILLVEDNPSDEALTLRALKKSGVATQVFVVHDGPEALDYLFCRGAHAGKDAKDLPQIVFLDLNLPRMGGLEVLAQLRADPRTKLLPVVILTSSNEERDRLAGYTTGANSYVVKPVDFIQFAEAVKQVGLYWLVINQPAPS